MNKALIVHYMNKYPGGHVDASDAGMSVYDKNGEKVVQLAKDGMGNLVCVSEAMGARDRHNNGPIPKWARVWKLHKDGKIGKSEEYAARMAKVGDASIIHDMGHDDAKVSQGPECPAYQAACESNEA